MADPNKQGFYSVFTPTTINAAANATKIAANEANIYAMAVEKGSQSLINFGKNTQWAGRQLTVGMTMPMVLFGSQAVKAFEQTNMALTQLQKVYGEGLVPPSQASIDQISKQVLDLGKNLAQTTGISQEFTVQVASSFAAMGKMGSQLTQATEQTVRLAKLGNLTQDVATRGVIALQNVYKLNTTQLGDAVNYFASIQKQTSLSMNDLIESESKVGPIIDQLGGSYRDTAVMILAMKEAGVPAAQSANALKSAFASIIAPTRAATNEFAKFGINVSAFKNAGGPVQMIEALQASLKNLSPLVREQLIEKLFGKYQFSRISALLENFNRVGSQTANAIKVAGASSEQLTNLANEEMKQATSSPSAQWQIALNTFKADLYPVGQMIMKIGTDVLKFANGVAKAFGGLPGPVKLVLGVLLGFVAISGPIIMLTGLLANFAGNILKGVFNLKQLVTGGKTLGQLLTPELIAAQNASDLFSKGVMGDADAIKLLNEQIVILTNNLGNLVDKMSTGAGLPGITGALTTEVGAIEKGALVAEQLKLPGFAEGGVVDGPGTGTSDSILARVSKGELIVPADSVKKMYVSGHTSMPFQPGSVQYESMMDKYPSLPGLQSSFPNNPNVVRVLSNLVNNSITSSLNQSLKTGATGEEFKSGFGNTGGTGFARSAALGGMNITPETTQALKEFEQELKNRILSLKKSTITDQDLANETRKLIDEQVNAQTAIGQVARSLNNASQQVGQVRVNPGADYVRAGVASGQLTKSGTLTYLNEVPVGQIRNKDGKITDAQLNQANGYQKLTVSAKNSIKQIEDSMKKAAQIESPSKVFNKEVGQPIVQGVQQGIQDALPGLENMVTTSMSELSAKPAIIDAWTASGKQMSDATAEGIIANTGAVEAAAVEVADKASSTMATRLKGAITGTAGKTGGLGLAMMLPMFAGMLPKNIAGQNVSGLTGIATTAASAGLGASMLGMGAAEGSMMATIGGMALPIAGVIGAFGLLKLGIDSVNNANREARNVIQETYGKNSVTTSYFGLSSSNLNQFDFSGLISGVKESTTSIQENKAAVDALTAAYANATDQMTKDYLNKIKGSNPTDLADMMKARYGTDLAQGMKPEKALQDISALLKAGGKDSLTRQFVLNGIGSKSTDNAATGFKSAVKTAFSPYESSANSLKKDGLQLPSRNGVTPAARVDSLKQGAIKDVATELLNVAQTTPANLKLITDSFKSAGGETSKALVNSNGVFKELKNQVEQSNPKMATWMDKMYKAGLSTVDMAKAISLLNAGVVQTPESLGKATDSAKTWAANIEKLFLDSKTQSTAPGGKSSTNPPPIATGPFTGTPQEKAVEKVLQGNLTAQNAQLKIARDQLSVQNKISQETKAQLQYQQQITGLQNDMKTAMITGNYLQAAGLKQQISGAAVDFNATSVQTKMQNQVDNLQSNADQINQALANLKDAIANGSTNIDKTILAAQNIKPIKAKTISADVAGGAPTVTTIIQVNGEVTGTSVTSSHPNVKTSVQTKLGKGPKIGPHPTKAK